MPGTNFTSRTRRHDHDHETSFRSKENFEYLPFDSESHSSEHNNSTMEAMEGFDDLDAFLENLIQELERRSPKQDKSEAQRNDKEEQAPIQENETGQGPITTVGSSTTNRLGGSASLGVSSFGGAPSHPFGISSHPFGETFSGGKWTEIETASRFPSVDDGGMPTETLRVTPFGTFGGPSQHTSSNSFDGRSSGTATF